MNAHYVNECKIIYFFISCKQSNFWELEYLRFDKSVFKISLDFRTTKVEMKSNQWFYLLKEKKHTHTLIQVPIWNSSEV